MASPGPADPLLLNSFLLTARSPFLAYVDFSSSIISRFPFDFSLPEHSVIFNRITHPYIPDAFEFLLLKHNLLPFYSLLPNNLRFGFPLGHMPPLLHTVILPNNPSLIPYMHEIADYLHKEVLAHRMSGPLTREETELILRGSFHSSPLVVSIQSQGPNIPDKIRICRHLSKASKTQASVNSHIRKNDLPTRFDTASKVAEIVSFIDYLSFPFSPPLFFNGPFALCALGLFSFSALAVGVFALLRYPDIRRPLKYSTRRVCRSTFRI
jgi:hypothetical protein